MSIETETKAQRVDAAQRDLAAWRARMDSLKVMWSDACRGENEAMAVLVELGALPGPKDWDAIMAEVDKEFSNKGAM